MPFTNEEFWEYAVECWLRGEPEPIAKLLRGDESVPPFARRWLAELALGSVKRRRGPKRKDPATAMLDSLRARLPVCVGGRYSGGTTKC